MNASNNLMLRNMCRSSFMSVPPFSSSWALCLCFCLPCSAPMSLSPIFFAFHEAVWVHCLFLRSPSQAPLPKGRLTRTPPPVVPHPESLAAQAARLSPCGGPPYA